MKPIPTDLVLQFVDDAIKFREYYESGGIPGIVPENKNEEWFVVPKEYIKDEWWERMKKE